MLITPMEDTALTSEKMDECKQVLGTEPHSPFSCVEGMGVPVMSDHGVQWSLMVQQAF